MVAGIAIRLITVARPAKVNAELSLVQDVGYIDNGSGFVFNDVLISIENLTGGAKQ